VEDQATPARGWGCTDLESGTLRRVLGSYPTGVAIVATRTRAGQPVGLTINSFASLSLEPPLVLWSLRSRSPSLFAFLECEHFTINVLASGQQELAHRFATLMLADRFAGVRVIEAPEGVPAIRGAVATLVCANHERIHAGDHLLLLGRVLQVDSEPGTPLVFHDGRYTTLARGLS
jgi:flavin reductase (DIM6/NTAB) family NADH-FMN oxidoreductase RutF